MVRRTFLKKAALAAVGAAVTSPLSALAKQPKGSARKKVLLINGSPRPDGNTFCALQEIATQLEKHGIEAEIFQIGNRPVRMCISCGGCNTVCPTCSCYETADFVNQKNSRQGERRREKGFTHGPRASRAGPWRADPGRTWP